MNNVSVNTRENLYTPSNVRSFPLKFAYDIVYYINDVRKYEQGISNLELQHLMYIMVCFVKTINNINLNIPFEVWTSRDNNRRTAPTQVTNMEVYKYLRNFGANSVTTDVFKLEDIGHFTTSNMVKILYNIIDRWYSYKPYIYFKAKK